MVGTSNMISSLFVLAHVDDRSFFFVAHVDDRSHALQLSFCVSAKQNSKNTKKADDKI